uniref:Uncharacterized protein n=1 Tax=Arundo donax TaxID=35708 RepID=A0A0A8ZNX3_ARUDO
MNSNSPWTLDIYTYIDEQQQPIPIWSNFPLGSFPSSPAEYGSQIWRGEEPIYRVLGYSFVRIWERPLAAE